MAGDWNHHSFALWRELRDVDLNHNLFSRTWPPESSFSLTGLQLLKVEFNVFTGQWPMNILSSARRLWVMSIRNNHFQGAASELSEGLGHLKELLQLRLSSNEFRGMLPGRGLVLSAFLSTLHIQGNHFAGVWPEDGLMHALPLRLFAAGENRFSGCWPPDALRGLSHLTHVSLQANTFDGTWAEESLAHAKQVQVVTIFRNQFAGTWPALAMQRCTSLKRLSLDQNHFAGTWPQDGFRGLLALMTLAIYDNRFAGAWSADIAVLPRLRNILIGRNSFAGSVDLLGRSELTSLALYDTNIEGAIASELADQRALESLRVGASWLEGSLPGRLSESQPFLEHLSMRELALRGTVPSSLGRWQPPRRRQAILILSFGLRGSLPTMVATISILSAFRNALQGYLPSFRLMTGEQSYVLLHNNLFSCSLARNDDLGTALSIALLGNHFKQPASSFPAWIHQSEREAFFTVSNKHAWELLTKAVASFFCFSMLVFYKALFNRQHRRYYVQQHASEATKKRVKEARLQRVIWQTQLLLGPCLVLAFSLMMACSQAQWLTCMTVLRMLQVEFGPSGLAWSVSVMLVLSMRRLVASFACIHRIMRICPGESFESLNMQKLKSGDRLFSGSLPLVKATGSTSLHASYRAWTLWILICCGISFPGATYSVLKAVPGFLRMSPLLTFLSTQSVSLVTAFLTSAALPAFTQSFHVDSAGRQDFILVGKLMAMPMLPCIVTYTFDEHCLGQWSSVWEPCTAESSPLDALDSVRIYRGNPYFLRVDSMFEEKLLSKHVLCTRGNMVLRACLNAILDRSAHLLLSASIHLSFTYPSMQVLRCRSTSHLDAFLQVWRVWGVLLIFGSTVPLLVTVSMAGIMVQHIILFGSLASTEAGEQHEEQKVKVYISMPQVALRVILAASMLLHLGMALLSASASCIQAVLTAVLWLWLTFGWWLHSGS